MTVDYTPISSFNRGQVLVEKGLEIGNKARGGQDIILKPGVDIFKEYVVAGCTVGTDQGSYMGLEANHPPSNSGYVGYTKDHVHFTAFPRQDQNAHSFPPMASLLMLTDKSVDGKKVKMVSWSARNNNDFANVGAHLSRQLAGTADSLRLFGPNLLQTQTMWWSAWPTCGAAVGLASTSMTTSHKQR